MILKDRRVTIKYVAECLKLMVTLLSFNIISWTELIVSSVHVSDG